MPVNATLIEKDGFRVGDWIAVKRDSGDVEFRISRFIEQNYVRVDRRRTRGNGEGQPCDTTFAMYRIRKAETQGEAVKKTAADYEQLANQCLDRAYGDASEHEQNYWNQQAQVNATLSLAAAFSETKSIQVEVTPGPVNITGISDADIEKVASFAAKQLAAGLEAALRNSPR